MADKQIQQNSITKPKIIGYALMLLVAVLFLIKNYVPGWADLKARGRGQDAELTKSVNAVELAEWTKNMGGFAQDMQDALKEPIRVSAATVSRPAPGAAGSLGANANIEIRAEPPEPPRFIGVIRSEKSAWTAIGSAGQKWGHGEIIKGPKGDEFIIRRITNNEIWCALEADADEIAFPDIDVIRRYSDPVGIKIAGLKKLAGRGDEFKYNGFVFHIEDIADGYFRVSARKSGLLPIHLVCFVF